MRFATTLKKTRRIGRVPRLRRLHAQRDGFFDKSRGREARHMQLRRPFGEISFGSYAIKRYRFCGEERDVVFWGSVLCALELSICQY